MQSRGTQAAPWACEDVGQCLWERRERIKLSGSIRGQFRFPCTETGPLEDGWCCRSLTCTSLGITSQRKVERPDDFLACGAFRDFSALFQPVSSCWSRTSCVSARICTTSRSYMDEWCRGWSRVTWLQFYPYKLARGLPSESCMLNVDLVEWKLVMIPTRDWCVFCEGLLQFCDSCNLCNPIFVFFYLLFGTHICELSITWYSRWHSGRRR